MIEFVFRQFNCTCLYEIILQLFYFFSQLLQLLLFLFNLFCSHSY